MRGRAPPLARAHARGRRARCRVAPRETVRACVYDTHTGAATHSRALPIIYGRGTPHTGAVRQWGCALHEGGGTELMAPT